MRKRAVYKGVNRYREYFSAARTIAGKISRIDGVIGILATGGIGRGYCDDYSDLDLTVYADHDRVRRIGMTLESEDMEVRFEEERNNWQKTADRTKYYLSW